MLDFVQGFALYNIIGLGLNIHSGWSCSDNSIHKDLIRGNIGN